MSTDIKQRSRVDWIDVGDLVVDADMQARCTVDALTVAIGHVRGARVVHADYVSAGTVDVPRQPFDLQGFVQPDVVTIDDLPEFCDVRVEATDEDGVVSIVTVWVPAAWNQRYLGLLGGATRTEPMLWEAPDFTRSITLPVALRNGFATAKSDGGNRQRSFSSWALPDGATELDWPLIENLAHRSTRTMTTVAKAVIEALTGAPPSYSYLSGCSGGGRQTLAHAQRHPADYDGYWAANPALHWTKFVTLGMWTSLVMKEVSTLTEAKLEAFRDGLFEANDGVDGLRDGVLGAFDPIDFDPHSMVGADTADGAITQRDAQAMQMIWEGPRRQDGGFLWYGLRPGTVSWGVLSSDSGMDIDAATAQPAGVCSSISVDGVQVPVPFPISRDYAASWVLRDPSWDWTTLTFEGFEEIFDRSVATLSVLDTADPDLTPLDQSGGKLIISHGAVDELIPVDGTVLYFQDVLEHSGGLDQVSSFVRLFVSDGDGHGDVTRAGPGLTMAAGMTALMRWVELGEEPDQIVGEKSDPVTNQVLANRPLYAYPHTARYQGSGDPSAMTSFVPHAILKGQAHVG